MPPNAKSKSDTSERDLLVSRPIAAVNDEESTDDDDFNKEEKNAFSVLRDDLERRRIGKPAKSRGKSAAIVLGQCVALIATSMNASSYEVESKLNGVFPMFLMLHSYVLLTFHLCWSSRSLSLEDGNHRRAEKKEKNTAAAFHRIPFTRIRLRTPWYYYLCLSVLDIGPNYLALLAYSTTSFASATLLQSLTIPSAMLFCRFLLGKRYGPMHFLGVALCLAGGTVTVLTDSSSENDDENHPHSYAGDLLAVLAALGYGTGDAAAEFWSKHVDRKEYLGMIGFFGSIWTLFASIAFERKQILESLFDATNGGGGENRLRLMGSIAWYCASLALYYVFESSFLSGSDATLLNLSLQCQNFWAVLFSVVLFRETPGLPFYAAVSLVVSGVFVYELRGNTSSSTTNNNNNDDGAATVCGGSGEEEKIGGETRQTGVKDNGNNSATTLQKLLLKNASTRYQTFEKVTV